MRFIDTNILIRYLTGDDSAKAAACRRLMEKITDGREQVHLIEAVLAETVFVLQSSKHYDVPEAEIRDLLAPIIALPGVVLDHKTACLRALDLIATYPALDFEDALQTQHMKRLGETEIYSYDTDFDRLEDVTRQEP